MYEGQELGLQMENAAELTAKPCCHLLWSYRDGPPSGRWASAAQPPLENSGMKKLGALRPFYQTQRFALSRPITRLLSKCSETLLVASSI